MVKPTVGILALQGGVDAHRRILERLLLPVRSVRTVAELDRCDALILPGGESTTLTRLIDRFALHDALVAFGQCQPLFGTCAGLILMGHSEDRRVRSLEQLDIEVARNAYGRQLQSFRAELSVDGCPQPVSALFIRAPRITRIGVAVRTLSHYGDAPVLVSQGSHFAMTCHPELAGDTAIHRRWLEQAFGKDAVKQGIFRNESIRTAFA